MSIVFLLLLIAPLSLYALIKLDQKISNKVVVMDVFTTFNKDRRSLFKFSLYTLIVGLSLLATGTAFAAAFYGNSYEVLYLLAGVVGLIIGLYLFFILNGYLLKLSHQLANDKKNWLTSWKDYMPERIDYVKLQLKCLWRSLLIIIPGFFIIGAISYILFEYVNDLIGLIFGLASITWFVFLLVSISYHWVKKFDFNAFDLSNALPFYKKNWGLVVKYSFKMFLFILPAFFIDKDIIKHFIASDPSVISNMTTLFILIGLMLVVGFFMGIAQKIIGVFIFGKSAALIKHSK